MRKTVGERPRIVIADSATGGGQGRGRNSGDLAGSQQWHGGA